MAPSPQQKDRFKKGVLCQSDQGAVPRGDGDGELAQDGQRGEALQTTDKEKQDDPVRATSNLVTF